MGRWSTGAWTAEECLRLELPYLLKNGYIQKGCFVRGKISWTGGFWVSFTSLYRKEERWLHLNYITRDKQTGKKWEYDYKIYLCEVPSNLGKGMIPYFICPESGKRCRILYQAYGYDKWKCREAYLNRIFYSSQICSRANYANTRYWAIQKQIEKLLSRKYKKFTYKGQATKFAKKVEKLQAELNYWDCERWSLKNMPAIFRKHLPGVPSDESLLF